MHTINNYIQFSPSTYKINDDELNNALDLSMVNKHHFLSIYIANLSRKLQVRCR